MTRNDIIQRFRDRIEQKSRTRLTHDELIELVQSFVDQLKTLDDQAAIDQFCAEELALLEEGYSKATIAKNYIRHYRDAIENATNDGTLPLTANTLLDYDYQKRSGETLHFKGHYAYLAMKYDNAEYTAISNQDNTRNNHKQDHLKPVQIDRYLEKARELLTSSDHNELAVGIAAVTGRRFSEVIQNKFVRTDHPYLLRFAGQLKKRSETEAYNTLCLIEATEVWKAINRFRKLDRVQELQKLSPQQINARMNKSVQRVAALQFDEIVPTLDGESATTIHNLRAVYAIAAIHFFCPPTKGDHRFLQEQLGHIVGVRDLQQLQNSSSTAHYFHYYLVDQSGNHIGTKGVLKEQPTEPEVVQPQLSPQPESATAIHSETTIKHKTAIENNAIKNNAIKNNAIKNNAIKKTAEITPESKFMDALTELSQTIGFLRTEAQHHKQIAESLQRDRDQLKLEVELLQQQVRELEQAKQGQVEQTEPLKHQIQLLRAENAAYKAKLDNLEKFARSFLGDDSPASPPDSMPKDQSAQPAIQTIETTEATPAAPKPTSKTISKSRSPGRRSARTKLEGAVRFIQERNQEVQHDQQWAITQSLIASLTGSNIALTVKPFWSEIKTQMDKYNHNLALDDRANYGRSGEIPQLKDEFESWFEAQPQPEKD
ncbi:MAG: telomere resolvase [Leptolyngbya sp. Prado105]|jgi:integrase|nr:telomere resolvase [Leptolyngbya sp. Prado105]